MKQLNGKEMFAFLNGIFQIKYEHSKQITLQTLQEQLFPNDSEKDVLQFSEYCEKIFEQGAKEDWDFSQIQTFLKKSSLSVEQQDAFVRFWKTIKTKIHQHVVQDSTWNNSLKKIAWRIDTKTKSKSVSDLNELTGIVELILAPNNSQSSQPSQVVRFELSSQQLEKVNEEFDEIKKSISKYL